MERIEPIFIVVPDQFCGDSRAIARLYNVERRNWKRYTKSSILGIPQERIIFLSPRIDGDYPDFSKIMIVK
ncbi:MAG: hypothetical protein WC445_04855 [Patescibacteria group bacterium]